MAHLFLTLVAMAEEQGGAHAGLEVAQGRAGRSWIPLQQLLQIKVSQNCRHAHSSTGQVKETHL